jgi:cobalt-zinc-cadmium efflux system protein
LINQESEPKGKERRDRIFEYRKVGKKRLLISLTITISVMFVEIVGGLFTNSIALLSDAGHMFTHAFAISISLFAIYLSQKPTCHHRTFGYYRAEILAALINGIFLLGIVGYIIYEAILRILNPLEIESLYMLLVAILGLSVNLISVSLLYSSHEQDINIKGVFFHMLGDAASSIGIVVVSIIIYFTDWNFLDPIISFVISIVIIIWAVGILRDSTRVLLEMAPSGLNVHIIEEDLRDNFNEILNIEHTHLWTITPNFLVFTTHIRIDENTDHDEFISKINNYLFDKYDIIESTVQITYSEGIRSCSI